MKASPRITPLLACLLWAFGLTACADDGEPGPAGSSCTVETNGDGTATVSCEDGTVATIATDAADGSCTVIDNGDGTKTVSCTDGTEVVIDQEDPRLAVGYATSEACKSCHAEAYDAWKATGHPYKVVAKEDVVAGTAYPSFVQSEVHGEQFAVDSDFFTDQAGVISINENTFPSGGWDDVSYVIGGYGWKARFMDLDGYIITGTDKGTADEADDDKVQYNFPFETGMLVDYANVPATSSTYHTGEVKPYTCGSCHTTGWIPDTDADTDDDLSDNQDGLPGIHGTWVETGVGCEACHGPSAAHADNPFEVTTPRNPTNSCGNCHIRGYPFDIDTSGGFIRHHEQYEEMVSSKHAAIGCEGCHDAHQPVKWSETYVSLDGTGSDPNPDFDNRSGIRNECATCHPSEAAAYDAWASDQSGSGGMNLTVMGAVECQDCHMPFAVKSATKAGDYHGDIPSHLFSINTAVDPATDPDLTTAGANPANPYLTLDWACGSCHTNRLDPLADFYPWAVGAVEANGGVHGSN